MVLFICIFGCAGFTSHRQDISGRRGAVCGSGSSSLHPCMWTRGRSKCGQLGGWGRPARTLVFEAIPAEPKDVRLTLLPHFDLLRLTVRMIHASRYPRLAVRQPGPTLHSTDDSKFTGGNPSKTPGSTSGYVILQRTARTSRSG